MKIINVSGSVFPKEMWYEKIFLLFALIIPLDALSAEYVKHENVIESVEKAIEALNNTEEISENICLSWFYDKKLENEIAIPVCKCERDIISKTISLDDVWYFQENIKTWNFLVYKKDERAIKINKAITDIRLKCLEEVENNLYKAVK